MVPREVERMKGLRSTTEKRLSQTLKGPPPKRVRISATRSFTRQATKHRRFIGAPVQAPVQNIAPTARLEVFVFGEGSSGELGLGTKDAIDVEEPRLNPHLDANSVGVVALATGGMHAVALTHDNKVLTWGVNDHHALGRDTTWEGGLRAIDGGDDAHSEASVPDLNPRESTPTAIPTDRLPQGTKIVQVAAGDSTSFVLTEEGKVYGWGTFRDSKGVYGFSLQPDGQIIKIQKEPLLISDLQRIVQLSVGNDFCLALDKEGVVFSWGTGEQCQLGRRLFERRRPAGAAELLPARISLRRIKIVSVHAGSNHAFAIDLNGDTWAWGSNNFGQTAIAKGAGQWGSCVATPLRVAALVGKRMKVIQGGSHHSIGVTHNHECLVWGRVDGGQLGMDVNGLPLDNPALVMVERGKPRILLNPTPLPIRGCIHAAAGPDHNIVITVDGKAYAWGFNANHQCGLGTDDDIQLATLMNGSQIRNKKLSWAGAGGQYSMLTA